jgi:hypothetical protein
MLRLLLYGVGRHAAAGGVRRLRGWTAGSAGEAVTLHCLPTIAAAAAALVCALVCCVQVGSNASNGEGC